MSTVVFLHIPKTAGQTVHNALVPAVGGPAHVSPIRVHTQAPKGPQMPEGYSLYSGHIDWTELDTLPEGKFVFSVLRDPRERIASFFLYLYKEAQALSKEDLVLPQNTGKRRLLENSADEYFLGGNASWQRFIRDHYDNFYCTYFATRLMRGYAQVVDLPLEELLLRAQRGLAQLDAVYSTKDLSGLEDDIERYLSKKISVTKTYHNKGAAPQGEARWPKLLERLEKDETRELLESFVRKDEVLMKRIGRE
ncbi:MAG: hypothetical protein ABJN72_06550 [Sulfitobacter sp.]